MKNNSKKNCNFSPFELFIRSLVLFFSPFFLFGAILCISLLGCVTSARAFITISIFEAMQDNSFDPYIN